MKRVTTSRRTSDIVENKAARSAVEGESRIKSAKDSESEKEMGMSKAMYLQVMAVNDMLGGITLEDIKLLNGGHIKFSVYPKAEYMNVDLMALELTTRPYNGLKRKGYKTVAEVVEGIETNADIKGIRGMGDKSCEEVMLSLFLYQFRCLPKERQRAWLDEVLRLNGIRKIE